MLYEVITPYQNVCCVASSVLEQENKLHESRNKGSVHRAREKKMSEFFFFFFCKRNGNRGNREPGPPGLARHPGRARLGRAGGQPGHPINTTLVGENVITSYSIHYTKLYEIDISHRQVGCLWGAQVGPRLDPTGPGRGAGPNRGARITSYNVCYTKLLRCHQGA